jgi:hypothetical protein
MFWSLIRGSIYQLLCVRKWIDTMGVFYSFVAYLLSIYIWNNYGNYYYYYYYYYVYDCC